MNRPGTGPMANSSTLPLGVAILAVLVGIVGFLYLLVVARGLWDLELWALALAVLILVLLLAANLYRLLVGPGASLVSILIEVVLLVYLVAVRNRFT